MGLALQDAIKTSIQTYFDGQDVLPQGRKYTKQYLDNFHNNVINPTVKKKSDTKVKKELLNANNPPD